MRGHRLEALVDERTAENAHSREWNIRVDLDEARDTITILEGGELSGEPRSVHAVMFRNIVL